MQVPFLTLGSVLLVGSIAFAFADFGHPVPESPAGQLLGRLYLLNDSDSVSHMRSRIAEVGIGKVGVATATKVFGPALERNAGSADRWSDVGETLLSAGNKGLAEYCYRRAAALAPQDLQTLLNIADFYSNTGDSSPAVAAFSRILSYSNQEAILRHNTFVYYERMHVRQIGMLADAIPDARSAQEYVRYLMEESDPAAVRQLWTWSQEKGFDDDTLTVDCVNYLFGKQMFEAAEEGWNRHFAGRQGLDQKSSGVFNGGFEYEFAGSDLDWHFSGFNGVKVARDSRTFHEGRFSLRIDFTGNDNPDFRHVSQVVFVRPGRYHFEAHIRTADITSDQGIRFSVRIMRTNQLLAETDALTGTNDWRKLETDVEVPTGITMAKIELARHRSIRIDNQLTGTARVYDLIRFRRTLAQKRSS
jgi:tetratricopeptide (TPR) repeat protein